MPPCVEPRAASALDGRRAGPNLGILYPVAVRPARVASKRGYLPRATVAMNPS
ncbi:Uncharacterised protein [Bordetella pertussis]|nr:Uncharacterised protein [Bordetella pertussis]